MNRIPEDPPGELRQKGFALIVVIWLGVLLSVMAAAFSSAVRSRVRSVAAEADTVRAEALADAGVRIALLELLNRPAAPSSPVRFPVNGTITMCSIGTDATMVIEVEDEEGKVNVNTSNEKLLVALFAGLGANRDDAQRYANRILGFRAADHDKRLDGAEADDYAQDAGGAAGPKDSEFVSVDELDQVLGLPAGIREQAKRFLTAFSTQDGIDPAIAPPGLKSVLVRGSNGISVASGTNADNPGETNAADGAFISSELPMAFISSSSRRLYTVRAEAVLTSGARYVSDVTVGIPDGRASQPVFQRWRRGQSVFDAGQKIPAPGGLHPC